MIRILRHERIPAVLMAAWLALISSANAAAPGIFQGDVTFAGATDLSARPELARRLLSPLTRFKLEGNGSRPFEGQTIDVSNERFAVYAPQREPRDGYGVLVFIPPWNDARLPPGWDQVLARRGVIFVTAARSGNDADILGRRAPLALIAAANIQKLYRVDPARVYVGGLSGGSRAALRLALGYPDLFRGAILNAGSDPIGADLPAPETSLMAEFQTSRIIFATGAHDEINLGKDEETRLSLRQWCVFDTDTETMAFRGHDIMDSGALDRALDALSKPKAVDAAPLASCRSGIAERVSARLDEVRKRLAAGDLRGANHLLEEIDRRFAGAAAPESVELRMQALP